MYLVGQCQYVAWSNSNMIDGRFQDGKDFRICPARLLSTWSTVRLSAVSTFAEKYYCDWWFWSVETPKGLGQFQKNIVFYWTVDEWMLILIWQGSMCPLFFFFFKHLPLSNGAIAVLHCLYNLEHIVFHALVRHKMTLTCYPQVFWRAHYTLCCDTELRWGMKSQKPWLEVQLWTCLFP